MKIQTKQTVSNKQVELTVTKHSTDRTYVITAVDPNDPNNTHEHTLTLGPVDGGVAIPTQSSLQKIFDDARQVAASHVVFNALVKDIEATLV